MDEPLVGAPRWFDQRFKLVKERQTCSSQTGRPSGCWPFALCFSSGIERFFKAQIALSSFRFADVPVHRFSFRLTILKLLNGPKLRDHHSLLVSESVLGSHDAALIKVIRQT